MKFFWFFIAFFLAFQPPAECILPADITFLIVDYKYSKDQGIKICEVQTANVSSFIAYDILYDQKNLIYQNFCSFIKQFQTNVWSSIESLSTQSFIEECTGNNWHILKSTQNIFQDKNFLNAAINPVNDPHDLKAYHGAVYCKSSQLAPTDELQAKYPGILVIDASIFPHQNNKLTMSELFGSDPNLAQYRPKWKIYQKKYSKTLSDNIARDFDNSMVVIKPHRSTLGNGVIIVNVEKLDKTLKLILKNKKKLLKSQDASYKHWLYDLDDTFLVEEFVASDPIPVKHLANNSYDPTYRSTFVLYCHNQQANIHFLEHLIKLPEKPIKGKGSLNEKHKTILKQPFYDKVSKEQRIELEAALTFPLLKMYELMLHRS